MTLATSFKFFITCAEIKKKYLRMQHSVFITSQPTFKPTDYGMLEAELGYSLF